MTSKKAPLNRDALASISASTLGHYQTQAEDFWQGTRDHDVTQNRAALLRHLRTEGPARILDLGCGPGRDLIAFTAAGHHPVGLDGAERFCEMARTHSGCEVLHQDFLALSLPAAAFHGIFANASLFHVPTQELPRVLSELWETLRPDGVLFASNPRGDNQEGFNGSRYGCYHDHTRWQTLVTACGFVELEHYYRPPGRPRAEQPWLATVYRKPLA
ncbi:MAG: methyltransferase domain-containing protein [Rhodobacterales bacterium]|nr:methyltransferase domain-containing protein [Rhodobacterales bacterium]